MRNLLKEKRGENFKFSLIYFYYNMIREKITLGGYELWLDRSCGAALLLFEKENSKHGLPIDAMGMYPNFWISGSPLTKDEKEELVNHLKSVNHLKDFIY